MSTVHLRGHVFSFNPGFGTWHELSLGHSSQADASPCDPSGEIHLDYLISEHKSASMDAREDECFRKSYWDWTLCDPLWDSSLGGIGGGHNSLFSKMMKSEITPPVRLPVMKS